VPLNREFVAKLLADIAEAMWAAKRLVERGFEELDLYQRLALRYLVVELVEAAAAACVHILREVFGVEVEGYPSCFLRMARLGVLPEALAERLAAAARLRNLLVHRYWVVDDRRVYEAVKRGLVDFEEFVERVRGLLGSEAGEEAEEAGGG